MSDELEVMAERAAEWAYENQRLAHWGVHPSWADYNPIRRVRWIARAKEILSGARPSPGAFAWDVDDGGEFGGSEGRTA